ncbi:MAG: hypothetical protein JWM35_1549 [Verrucomicrobia bacterium]|nr:hypothetical protein [Verrucomicrobiota bacterium]
MSNNEAKFILGAYRANGRDADNSTFADALRQARNDPALAAWLARSQSHDAAVAAKLREISPPAGLREAILAGAKASRAPRMRWRTPTAWLALAASIAVLLTVTVSLRQRLGAAEAARMTDFAVNDTLHARHGSHGAPAGALVAALSQPSTHLGASALPVDFNALKSTGCRTVSFAGHDVLEVCFKRNGEWFHCYIANRADFPAIRAVSVAALAQQAQLASASWSDATHHFVVVSEAGLEAVKRLL